MKTWHFVSFISIGAFAISFGISYVLALISSPSERAKAFFSRKEKQAKRVNGILSVKNEATQIYTYEYTISGNEYQKELPFENFKGDAPKNIDIFYITPEEAYAREEIVGIVEFVRVPLMLSAVVTTAFWLVLVNGPSLFKNFPKL